MELRKVTFSAISGARVWIEDITRVSIFFHHGEQGNYLIDVYLKA